MCEKEMMDDFSSHNASVCQHRGVNERPLKMETKRSIEVNYRSKGQLYNSKRNLTVISACSHMSQEADRQLQLSFDKTDTVMATQRSSISLKL